MEYKSMVELIQLYNSRHPEYHNMVYIKLYDDFSGGFYCSDKRIFDTDFFDFESFKLICETK